MEVADSAVIVHPDPPMSTLAPVMKFDPLIVMKAPPSSEDVLKGILEMIGATLYVKELYIALWLSKFVTDTETIPVACAGVLHVIDVGETTTVEVQRLVPNLTIAPVRKPVPDIVTAVPPAIAPELTERPLKVG